MRQITNHILMVKPTGFNYNAETAANNYFQHSNSNFSNVTYNPPLMSKI